MKVLVTGAGGKLGSNLVRRLTERGDRVPALDPADTPSWARVEPFRPEVVAGDFAHPAVAEHGIPKTRLRFTRVHAGTDFLTYQMRLPGMLNRARGGHPRAGLRRARTAARGGPSPSPTIPV
jgi:hypothetical protein